MKKLAEKINPDILIDIVWTLFYVTLAGVGIFSVLKIFRISPILGFVSLVIVAIYILIAIYPIWKKIYDNAHPHNR